MNRYSPKAGLGASSIMLILVILCLTVFTVLAFISARSDHTLTQTAADSTADYYAADNAVQKRLMELDTLLHEGKSPDTMEGVTGANGEYSFTVAVDDNRVIAVSFTVKDDTYSVTGYRVDMAERESEEQQTLQLYQ